MTVAVTFVVADATEAAVALEVVNYCRLVFVHYAIDHVSLASGVIIEMNATTGLDSVIVDPSAGFIEVVNVASLAPK